MEEYNKEVNYHKYCEKCKHHELDEVKDPCNECLAEFYREGTEKPLYFEEAEKFKNGRD